MTSWQIKLGRFSENSKAASLALSIKASAGLSERVGMESAGADAASGGSGQGGRSGCLPRFKMGGASEQAGVLSDFACGAGGRSEADWRGGRSRAARATIVAAAIAVRIRFAHSGKSEHSKRGRVARLIPDAS